jgi:hypothetical protein
MFSPGAKGECMANKAHDQVSRTVTDDQIVTEKKHPRRSFLTAAGAVLGTAAALVSGAFAEPQEKSSDPDAKKGSKASDPDEKKSTSKKSSTKKSSTKKSDKKESDPDKKQ